MLVQVVPAFFVPLNSLYCAQQLEHAQSSTSFPLSKLRTRLDHCILLKVNQSEENLSTCKPRRHIEKCSYNSRHSATCHQIEASGQQHAPVTFTYRKHFKLTIEYETERSSGLVLTICREKNFLSLPGNGKTAVILIYPVIYCPLFCMGVKLGR